MNPDRVISVIPWEMASEYVARMTACEGAESEAYYHEAYHAYWEWGRLDSSGFTERAFQAARAAEREAKEAKAAAAWWSMARAYSLFCATNGQKRLADRNLALETQWDGLAEEERAKWIADVHELGSRFNDRLRELCS
jgi:hypothetical protein